MSLVEYTQHIADTKKRLIELFKGSTDFIAWINSYIKEVQIIEGVIFDLLDDRSLDTAEGVQLDILASIVGVERGNFTDDELRQRIRAQIKVNISSGLSNDLLEIVKLLYPTSNPTIEDFYTAACVLDSGIGTTEDFADIDNLVLQSAKPAGVLLHYIYSLSSPNFQMGDEASDYQALTLTESQVADEQNFFSGYSSNFKKFYVGKETLQSSVDGTTWVVLPTYTPGFDIARTGFDYGNRYYIIGDQGSVQYTEDGVNFVQGPSSGSAGDVTCSATDGSTIVFFDGSGARYSTDGTTWAAGTLPAGTSKFIYSMVYAAGLFVAVGEQTGATSGCIIYSADGVTWSNATNSVTGVEDHLYSGIDYNFNSSSYDPAFYVIGINGNTGETVLFSSEDGMTWPDYTFLNAVTTVTVDGTSNGTSLKCLPDGSVLAAGQNGVLYSTLFSVYMGSPSVFDESGSIDFRGISYDNDAGRILLVGNTFGNDDKIYFDDNVPGTLGHFDEIDLGAEFRGVRNA